MIGVFDSGVGGLSVWREMIKLMPGERFIYVADSGFCPYGAKSKDEIIDRADRITEYLIANGAAMIVVACNTATAAAIEYLRSVYSVPFVGMEPAVKPAALNSVTGVIGVLATKGTFNGELYLRTLHKFADNVTVIEKIGEGLVELVENGETDTDRTLELLKKYILPMLDKNADHLVLGCTHYPFLTEAIGKIVGNKMAIVNSAPAVAKRADEILHSIDAGTAPQNTGRTNEFITTGNNIELLKKMVHNIVPDKAQEYIYKKVSI